MLNQLYSYQEVTGTETATMVLFSHIVNIYEYM